MPPKRVVPTRTCPHCGKEVPRARGVCPECGNVTRWFKIRLGLGCAFAAAGFLGIGIMLFMALTRTQ